MTTVGGLPSKDKASSVKMTVENSLAFVFVLGKHLEITAETSDCSASSWHRHTSVTSLLLCFLPICIEAPNLRMAWVGKGLRDHEAPPFPQHCQTPTNPVPQVSHLHSLVNREGDSAAWVEKITYGQIKAEICLPCLQNPPQTEFKCI